MYESALRSFSLITVLICDCLEKEYHQKAALKNVNEIDYFKFVIVFFGKGKLATRCYIVKCR